MSWGVTGRAVTYEIDLQNEKKVIDGAQERT